jgi:hypothetical protein
MTLQWSGPLLAALPLGTIAFGHVAVRRANYLYGTRPVPYFFVLGLAFLLCSLLVTGDLVSGVLGILGVTTLWDAFELIRQEKRIRRGHARANPNRPVETNRQKTQERERR